MNKRFAAVANLAFSSSQAVFTIITGLVMVPVYLKFFSMSTYGAWLASGNIIAMITIIEPGIATVATQKLSDSYGLNDKNRFSEVFGSALVLSTIFCLIVVMIGLTFSPFIPAWLNEPTEHRQALSSALAFSSVGAGTSFIFYLLGAVPQAWQRTVVPGIIGLLALSANIITILLALYANLGIIALGLGSLALSITYIIGYLLYIIVLWRRLDLPKPTVSIHAAREIWNEAKMLLLVKIAGTIGKYLEAPAAALAVSTEAAAVLVLTGRVLNAVQMFADRVGTAVFAGLSHMSARAQKAKDYTVIREVIVVSTVISGLGIGLSLALSKSIISVWVGGEVFGGIHLLLLLALSSFMTSRKDLISCLLVAMGQIKDASRWLAVEAVLRVFWIALFVLLFKVPGIPLAATLAAFIALIGLNRVLLCEFSRDKNVLYLPGLKGFAISLGLGMLYMYFVPEMRNWPGIVFHGLFLGLLMLMANLFDGEWLAILRRTIIATYNEFGLRKSTV